MKIYLVFVAVSITLRNSWTIQPGCACVEYRLKPHTEGRFWSADWPSPYSLASPCTVFKFSAPPAHIVRLVFTHFDIGHHKRECVGEDWVRVYLEAPEDGVSPLTPWTGLLCGALVHVPDTLYSTGSTLVLALRTFVRSNHTGFAGTFSAINISDYVRSGDEVGSCSYQFSSDSPRGRFFSPRFPSSYPPNTACNYTFSLREKERIEIVFNEVSLGKGDESCVEADTALRGVEVRAGKTEAVLAMCRDRSGTVLLSSAPTLLLTFTSGSHWPGQGFSAQYTFHLPEAVSSIENNLDISNGPHVSPARGGCRLEVIAGRDAGLVRTSRVSTQQGSCSYLLEAEGRARITLDLRNTLPSQHTCEEGVLSAWESDQQALRLCLARPPAGLRHVFLSSGPRLQVTLVSSSLTYNLLYNLTTDTRVSGGGRQLDGVPCGYSYSAEEGLGYLTSPNYPWLYPADTECLYLVYAPPGLRVRLVFLSFDLEGVPPCGRGTASDWVEVETWEGGRRRHCGQGKPATVLSESNYLRLVFSSNGRLDGTGFNASYHFVPPPPDQAAVLAHTGWIQLLSTLIIIILPTIIR